MLVYTYTYIHIPVEEENYDPICDFLVLSLPDVRFSGQEPASLSVCGSDTVDPRQEGRDSGVNARVVTLTAPDAPGHQPDLSPHAVLVLDQGAAAVALEGGGEMG